MGIENSQMLLNSQIVLKRQKDDGMMHRTSNQLVKQFNWVFEVLQRIGCDNDVALFNPIHDVAHAIIAYWMIFLCIFNRRNCKIHTCETASWKMPGNIRCARTFRTPIVDHGIIVALHFLTEPLRKRIDQHLCKKLRLLFSIAFLPISCGKPFFPICFIVNHVRTPP